MIGYENRLCIKYGVMASSERDKKKKKGSFGAALNRSL